MSYTCVKHGSTHHYFLNGVRVKAEEVPKSTRDTLRCTAPTYLQLAGEMKGQRLTCIENFSKEHRSLGKHYYSDGAEIPQKKVPAALRSIPCASRYEGEAPIVPRKPTKFRKAKSPSRKAKSPPKKSPSRKAKSPPKRSPPKKSPVRKSPPRKAKSPTKKLPGVKQVASKAARVPRKPLPPPPVAQPAPGEIQKPLLRRKA